MNKTKIMLLASASFLLIMTGGCESKISSEAGSQIYDEKKQYSNDGDNIIDNHSFEKELDVIDNIFVVDNSEIIIQGANKNGVAIIGNLVSKKVNALKIQSPHSGESPIKSILTSGGKTANANAL